MRIEKYLLVTILCLFFTLPLRGEETQITLWEDFESPGQWENLHWSDKAELSLNEENASEGKHSLKVSFTAEGKKRKNKGVVISRGINVDLSRIEKLIVDIYNDSPEMKLAIALNVDEYYESISQNLQPGWNKDIVFDLERKDFKSRSTGWQYKTPLNRELTASTIALIFYRKNISEGTIYVDNLRFDGIPVMEEERRVIPIEEYIPPKIVSLHKENDPVGKYEPFELTVNFEGTYQYPYDPRNISLSATFSSNGGRTCTVPGFLYSGLVKSSEVVDPVWKVRFAPDEAGEWKYRVTVTNPAGSDSSNEETFTCISSNNKGYVRVSKVDPLYFEFDSGEFYYPIGQNVCWASLDGYERYFSRMHASGENWGRIWMSSWEVALEWRKGGYYRGLGNYNLKNAEKLDAILSLAAKYGIYLQLVINNHGQLSTKVNPEWRNNPYNALNGGPCKTPIEFFTNEEAKRLFKARLRYIVARWGWSQNLLAWELWNEVTFVDGFDLDIDTAWHKEMAGYLKEIDPFKHLITTSYAGSLYEGSLNPDVWKLEDISFTQFHMYTPRIVSAISGAYQLMSEFEKPYVMTEFGRGTEDGVDEEDPYGTNIHAGLWSQFMTPSAGNAMPWWWDTYIAPQDLYYHWNALSEFATGEDRRAKNLRYSIAGIAGKTEKGDILLNVQGILNNYYALLWICDLERTKFEDKSEPSLLIENASVKLDNMLDGTYLVTLWDTYKGMITNVMKLNSKRGTLLIPLPAFREDMACKVEVADVRTMKWSKKTGIPAIVTTAHLKTKRAPKSIFIERIKKPIIIDGNLDDWGLSNASKRRTVGKIAPSINSFIRKGSIEDDEDLSGEFYLRYDKKNLYFAIKVTDDKIIGRKSGSDIWEDDCVELWLDAKYDATPFFNMPFNPGCYQINFAPMTEGKLKPEVYAYRNFNSKSVSDNTEIASRILSDADGNNRGYVVEARIPTRVIYGLIPCPGETIGLSVSICDRDLPNGKWSHILWAGQKEDDATQWGNAIFE